MNVVRLVNGRRWRVCVYRTARGWASFVEGGRGNRAGCTYGRERPTFLPAARDAVATLRARA